jgi:hypothetical protein
MSRISVILLLSVLVGCEKPPPDPFLAVRADLAALAKLDASNEFAVSDALAAMKGQIAGGEFIVADSTANEAKTEWVVNANRARSPKVTYIFTFPYDEGRTLRDLKWKDKISVDGVIDSITGYADGELYVSCVPCRRIN